MSLPCRIGNILSKCLHVYTHVVKRNRSAASVGYYIRSSKTLQWNIYSNGFSIQFTRGYAKGKDKKKDKAKVKVHVNENELSEVINVESLKNQMQRSVEVLKDEFVKNLSLRSSSGSIESLVINLDGKDHTLQELAQIVRKNPKMIVVNMSVFPQAIPAVMKAIQTSGMNLNPQQDGTSLYIPVQKVTKEHREVLARNAKQLFVKCKDNIRDVQNKQVKALKKKPISEDEMRSVQQQIISLADDFISQAETILDNKQNELLGNQ